MAFWNRKEGHNETDEQSEEAKSLVGIVQQKYRKAYDAKSSLHKLWEDCYNAYMSEYFKQNLPDYKSQEISNYVFSTVETVIPIMVANNPKILVLPQKEVFQQKADVIQRALDFEWQRTKFFSKLVLSCRSGLIFGTVPIMMIWDKNSDNGLGNAKPVIVSPFNIFPDPSATCVDDAEYIIYATYKNVGEIIAEYPEKANLLRKSTGKPQDTYLAFGKDTTEFNPDTSILYIEMFSTDYSMEVSIEEEGGDKYKVEKRKYPNGRKITIAGDVLLDDSGNPYNDGKFPIVLWKCYDVPGRFWGRGEVENIMSPQQAKCDITNAILDNAKHTANTVWIVDKNAGVEKNTLTNRPGLIIRKNPGSEVHREPPPSLPAYIQNIIEVFNQDIEHISGVYDVTRGERPTGITAAAAIQALNEQAQGRIKLKVQQIEQMLSELGGLWLSRIQQFWDTKRDVRVMDSDYNVQFDTIDKSDIDGDFDVIVAAGSTMAVNKTARLQQLIQMAQTQAEDGLPMVDRQTVLENADLPNLEEILQRFAQIKEQQMMEQQMMAQQQAEQQMMMQQAQGDMQMQQAQQQAQIQSQQAEQQASRDIDSSEIAHMMDMQKMALQQQNEPVQSESGSNELEALLPAIQMIAQMSPEELLKAAEEDPQIAQLIEMLSQLPVTEQSQ
jgi:cyclopropane fatty-acyl-phospholipid synthase-like methyltransferase